MKTIKSTLDTFLSIKPVSGKIMREKVINYLDKKEKRKPLASNKILRKKIHQVWYVPSFIKQQH